MEQNTLITYFLATIVLIFASGSGISLSRVLPWDTESNNSRLSTVFGFGLAPLITGVLTALVLWFMPGKSHSTHLFIVLFILAVGSIPGFYYLLKAHSLVLEKDRSPWFFIFTFLLIGFSISLLLDLVAIPLIQNDSLEYATVGRILFEARDLAAYPAIEPSKTASGFYGPWTHPPVYVSLIYLANVIQGNADSTQIMRFIAPWSLFAATACIFYLGQRISNTTAFLSALLFISTPLLFLGAASAMIDPIAVLGFTLAFVTFVCLKGTSITRGVPTGLILGLSLWTHSEAILFPFLLLPLLILQHSSAAGLWKRILPTIPVFFVTMTTALVVGAAPYVRNIKIFGSPISDNPVVFAFEPLKWSEYFQMQRGLSHVHDVVQYGVFKGFFAIEAYSFIFWLALLSIPFAINALSKSFGYGSKPNESLAASSSIIITSAFLVVIFYLLGAALSASMGINLMIKNERYMLIIIPCVALLAGAGLDASIRGSKKMSIMNRLRTVILFLVVIMLTLQLLVLVIYRLNQLYDIQDAANTGSIFDRWPPYSVVKYLKMHTPEHTRVLTLKPADMFYSDRKMVSYLDPALIHFYSAKDTEEALKILKELGVGYVHLPDYFLPPLYNSKLMKILSDNRYSTLEHEKSGYQIYRLRGVENTSANIACKPVKFSTSWKRIEQVVLGGRKSLIRVPIKTGTYFVGSKSESWNRLPVFQRETTTVLVSEQINIPPLSNIVNNVPEHFDEYIAEFDFEFEGDAYIHIYTKVLDSDGDLLGRQLIADLPVTVDDEVQRVSRRLKIPIESRKLVLEVEHRGMSILRIISAKMHISC